MKKQTSYIRNMEKIPVIICNYKHPKFTRRCVKSIRKFYPNIKIIIIDDLSPNYKPFNFNNSIEKRSFQHLGHGHSIDAGVKEVKSTWFFTVDHDVVFTRPGYFEYLWEQRKGFVAVGPEHVYSSDGNYVNAAAALWKKEPIKKYRLSFVDYEMPNRPRINPGVLLCRKLEELGYKINYLGNQAMREYGTHIALAHYADNDFKYGYNFKL